MQCQCVQGVKCVKAKNFPSIDKSKGVKVAFTPRCVLAVALPAIYSNILIHVMVKEGE